VFAEPTVSVAEELAATARSLLYFRSGFGRPFMVTDIVTINGDDRHRFPLSSSVADRIQRRFQRHSSIS
jgi:hypothetical protein